MKKKKLLNSKIQQIKYNDFFVKKILFSKNLTLSFRILGPQENMSFTFSKKDFSVFEGRGVKFS